LQVAQNTVFHFLPKSEEPRRKRLETALRKRLDDDEVESIANRFNQITDSMLRARLVERLQAML
jgi:hypothetical protein